MGEPVDQLVDTVEETSHRPGRRRRQSRGSSSSKATARLRSLYFALAATWGFLTGTGAVLAALSLADRPAHLGLAGTGLIAGAGAFALLGGFVVAAGYRTARRRVR